MPLAPGNVFGRYRVVQLLGSGGMGAVYLVEDTVLGRRVALKLLRGDDGRATDSRRSSIGATAATTGAQDGAIDPSRELPVDSGAVRSPWVDRLLREARLAARVRHPHAVAVFDVGEIDGTPYLTMEFVAGATLRSRVRKDELTSDRRLGWLVDVAEALEAAHASGVVHRDIKPENVMIRDDGTIKVVDFGIARALDASPESPRGEPAPGPSTVDGGAVDERQVSDESVRYRMVGTLAYMSPEQVRGGVVDERSDQFSWGVLAYELLTGSLPWHRGDGNAELARTILSTNPPPPSAVRSGIEQHVDAVVLRALAKDPGARFPSMAALVSALRGERGAPGHRPRVALTRRARVTWALLLVVGPVLLLLGTRMLDSRPQETALVAGANEATDGEPRSGSKMSKNPEALEEFRAGMVAARGAENEAARRYFERATELDPTFAAAHLRKVLVALWANDDARNHLSQAFQHRADLDEHDRALLHAVEAWTRVPSATPEVIEKLEARTRVDPDPDNLLQLCRFRFILGDYRGAVASCDDASKRDPSLVSAIWLRGMSALFSDDISAAKADLERCIALSPNATSCINELSQLAAGNGDCIAALSAGNRLSATGFPRWGWELVADASLATGRPVAEARAAIDRRVEVASPEERPRTRQRMETMLALYEGDLVASRRALDSWLQSIEADTAEDEHADAFEIDVALSEEQGNPNAAAQVARRYLARQKAWTPAVDVDPTILAFAALHRNGALSSDELGSRRSVWLADMQSRMSGAGAGQWGVTPGTLWIAAYANGVASAADARDAVAAAPSFQPLPPRRIRLPDADQAIGHAYLAAGMARAAIPHLRRAAKSCFSLSKPIEQARAMLELGLALDATGEKDEACAMYRSLAARWTSKSVTGDKARARARACARE